MRFLTHFFIGQGQGQDWPFPTTNPESQTARRASRATNADKTPEPNRNPKPFDTESQAPRRASRTTDATQKKIQTHFFHHKPNHKTHVALCTPQAQQTARTKRRSKMLTCVTVLCIFCLCNGGSMPKGLDPPKRWTPELNGPFQRHN